MRIYNVLIITKDRYTDHLKAPEKVQHKIVEVGLKLNAEAFPFGQTEMKYLGFWISKNGVRTLFKKIDGIK